MKIHFTKMHGAGNDFIVVDDMDLKFPWQEREWLSRIASRRTGVGCEGVVLIQPDEDATFRMRFFNPDGGEAEMCGNATRCIAVLAHKLGLAPRQMRIATVAGILEAECLEDGRVCVRMTPPKDRSGPVSINVGESTYLCRSVNTGVPHAVVEVEELAALDIVGAGRAIREDHNFSPEGTNADFVLLRDDGSLALRTYERGVEDETLACGTGVVASAVVMVEQGRCKLPIDVLCASGDTLRVGGRVSDGRVVEVTKTGPASIVYEGTFDAPRH